MSEAAREDGGDGGRGRDGGCGEIAARWVDAGFAYRREPVLSGFTLDVRRGELLFLIGRNGAGKSTAIKLLAGLLAPTSGRVEAFGSPPHGADRRALAQRLSYLPQSYRLAFPFTALEIVLMGRYARGRGGLRVEGGDDVGAARAAMTSCDVLGLAERRWDELSGGEARRVLLAQALCQGAELLVLDEPTAALDPAHAIHLFETLTVAMGGGTTAVVVSHDLNLAARFGDRVAVVDDGRVVACGAPVPTLQDTRTRAAFAVDLTVGTHGDGATPFVVPR